MSGKRSKKIRKVARAAMGARTDEIFNALCDRPLGLRMRIATSIVFKRKV